MKQRRLFWNFLTPDLQNASLTIYWEDKNVKRRPEVEEMVEPLQENIIYKIASFKYCIPEQQYFIPNSFIHFSRVQSTQIDLIGNASANDLSLLEGSRVFSTFKVVEDFRKRVMANILDTESNG